MKRIIKFDLPIYYEICYKTKKNKIILISMNWERNAHYHLKNKVKQHYHSLVYYKIKHLKIDMMKKYKVRYKLFYKNSGCDMMNVVTMIDKFMNDGLQEMAYIENDNVKFYKKCEIEVAERDKENPRVEVEIEEI